VKNLIITSHTKRRILKTVE